MSNFIFKNQPQIMVTCGGHFKNQT